MKQKLLNYITRHLFKFITAEEFLRMDAGKLIIGNHILTNEEKAGVIADAQAIKNTKLWSLLLKEMQYVAQKRMYFESSSEDDILAGKMTLWTIDIMDKKINNLTKLK